MSDPLDENPWRTVPCVYCGHEQYVRASELERLPGVDVRCLTCVAAGISRWPVSSAARPTSRSPVRLTRTGLRFLHPPLREERLDAST